jgi:Ca-activated chloride channel family protein
MEERRLWSVVVCALLVIGCGGALSGTTAPGDDPGTLSQTSWGTGEKVEGPLVLLTDPGELPELRVASEERPALPLEHTHVRARLSGFVAEVEVAQTFSNAHPEPIEAVYIFPLPENSAVHHMEMRIGERVIVAEIKERNQARQTYETAKAEGFTAALLEQERPNVFTQSVANIAPGKKIDVVVRYVQDLSYDAGLYEFVFPMVVGPRYIPGAPLAQEGQTGAGTKPDTDRVPDASRITPPYLGKGQRSGHDISLEVVVDGSLPVNDVKVPTHDVEKSDGDGGMKLALAAHDTIPNRDFVMRYRVVGDKPRATLVTSTDQGSGYFALVIHPPLLPVDKLVGRREVIFVVDVSGSMSGEPLSFCKEAMRSALSSLRPVDTFNIITFSGSTGKLFPEPQPVDRTSLAAALEHVERMRAGGGTEMLDAVHESLGSEVGEGRHRYVFFMTDGEVGNDAEIIGGAAALVERQERIGRRARVFGFGVSSAPNRSLLDGMSRAGKGLTVYATARQDVATSVDRFYRYIDQPVVQELAVDGLGGAELYPARLPELFASHPIIVHGRFDTPPSGEITVRGTAAGEDVAIPVTITRARPLDKEGVLGSLWARAKIAELETALWSGSSSAEQGITELGLEYGLVTQFTSFVAVDRAERVGDGKPRTIVQSVEVPKGVDPIMAGAETPPILEPRAISRAPGSAEDPVEPEPTSGDAEVQLQVDGPSRPTPPAAPPNERGCYCRVGHAGGNGWVLALLLAGAALMRRRVSPR